MNFVSNTIGFEVRQGNSTVISSNILSCIEGFLFIDLDGLSQSPDVPVPLSSDPELHSLKNH